MLKKIEFALFRRGFWLLILICNGNPLASAAKLSAKDYIVGGQEVADPDPVRAATVGIFDPSPDGHSGALCTGTLIRKDMAVTAAHCIEPGGAKPTVIFGKDLHSPEAVHRAAEAVAVNPKWPTHQGRGMDQGDIALVKFKGGLPAGYETVPMVKSDQQIQSGEKVTLAGYGISNAQTHTGAGRLRKTQVSILKNRPGKSEMILDQSHGHGACHGDSGGPAFVRENGKIELAGVTNRGYPNQAPDDCRHKVVYTKVPAYEPWIRASEKKLGAPQSGGFSKIARKSGFRPRIRNHQRVHRAHAPLHHRR
jgi:secreted trypsin-like serine protease